MGKKYVMFRCMECGRFMTFTAKRGDGHCCQYCGGAIIPLGETDQKIKMEGDGGVLFECDRRACKIYNEECRHLDMLCVLANVDTLILKSNVLLQKSTKDAMEEEIELKTGKRCVIVSPAISLIVGI